MRKGRRKDGWRDGGILVIKGEDHGGIKSRGRYDDMWISLQLCVPE